MPLLSAIAFLCLPTIHQDSSLSESSTEQKKYVGFHLNRGRLGNQLFHLFAGYGIARILNRIQYLPFEEPRSNVENHLNYLEKIFPRLKQTYVLAKRGIKQRTVKFAKTGDSYVDPSRLSNLTDEYLLLNYVLGQNPRYFENYITDVHNILQFSDEVKQSGSRTINSLKSYSGSMCIHVRMTDFIKLGLHSNLNTTTRAANALAKRRNISHFIIFGDDQHFMLKMSRNIVKDGGWNDDAVFVSKYQESMDFYLSSLMCDSFLISAAVSTFGWWLAFLTKNQNAVYYLNFTRPNVYVRKKEYFL